MIKKIDYNGDYKRSTRDNNGLLPYKKNYLIILKKYRGSKKGVDT